MYRQHLEQATNKHFIRQHALHITGEKLRHYAILGCFKLNNLNIKSGLIELLALKKSDTYNKTFSKS